MHTHTLHVLEGVSAELHEVLPLLTNVQVNISFDLQRFLCSQQASPNIRQLSNSFYTSFVHRCGVCKSMNEQCAWV